MDEIVDANVWLIASQGDAGSLWNDSQQVSQDEARVVLDWVESFVRDRARMLVLDQLGKIYEEFRKKNRWPDAGFKAFQSKMIDVRVVDVTPRADGYAEVLADVAAVLHEPTDQLYVAVAIADGGKSEIVNAADSDWTKAKAVLDSHGVRVHELLSEFLDRHRE